MWRVATLFFVCLCASSLPAAEAPWESTGHVRLLSRFEKDGINILRITFSTGLITSVDTEDGKVLVASSEGKPPLPAFRTPAKIPALKYARLRRKFRITGTFRSDNGAGRREGQYTIASFRWMPEPSASTEALREKAYMQIMDGKGLIQIILRDDMSAHGYSGQVDVYRRRFADDDSKLVYVGSRSLSRVDRHIGQNVFVGIFLEQDRISDDDMICVRFYPSGDTLNRYIEARSRRRYAQGRNTDKPNASESG